MDGRVSENLRTVASKLLELSRFTSPNQSSTLILNDVGGRCIVDIFKLTATDQSINREVYDICNEITDKLIIERVDTEKLILA